MNDSKRESKLTPAKKYSSARRKTSVLDFDLSRSRFGKDQRDSMSSEYCPSIAPMPADSIGLGHKSEKKVAFNLEHFPILSKARSSTVNFDFSKRLMSAEVMEDAVKYSLDHKADTTEEFTSFLQLEEFLDPELFHADVEYDQTEELSKSDDRKPSPPVVLDGKLKLMGTSENHVRIIKAKKPPSSKKASLGDSPANVPLDIWPWPWLNPEMRARSLYKSHLYHRVTFHYQNRLPTIPLPTLGHSLNWCLQSVKACVRAKVFAVTEKVVQEFALGEGKIYHEHLKNESSLSSTNWIKEFLPNYSHCFTRLEAPLLNTAIVAPFMYDLWPERADTQLSRASILVELVVEFWQLIRDERLVPISIVRDGDSACMHEFRKLFSSVKLPGIPKDEIYYCFHTQLEGATTPRHIIVFYKGHIFSVEVVDKNYIRVGLEEITRRLWYVMKSVDDGMYEEGIGVGILTSQDRNIWSEYRLHLMKMSVENQACLNEIEQAMFVLSLDYNRVVDTERLLHEAIFANGCNRWYDKSLNFYVYKNGLVTVNVNSSIIEGSTVAFLLHYIHLQILENADKWDDDVLYSVSTCSLENTRTSSRMEELFNRITSQASFMSNMALVSERLESLRPPVEEPDLGECKILIFDLDEQLKLGLEEAKENFLEMSLSLRTSICRFEDYESNIFGLKAINTDAFAHLVMQLSFFRMYYRPPSVGSKVSLRRFHFGRYEIMCTTTSEAVTWCKIMLDPNSSFEDRSYHFVKAEKKHISLLKNVYSGKGCVNHLAALRVIAEDVFSKTPKLLQDEGFRLAGGVGCFDIYAECLGVGCTSCPVLWPTSPAGYGIGYFVANSKIVFNVTSWEDENGTSAELFTYSLTRTLKELHEFLRRL